MLIIIEEKWKDIKGYEGYYQISNCGRVKSLARTIIGRDGMLVNLKEKILKSLLVGIKDSYLSIKLYRDSHSNKRFIHKLVAEAFIGTIPDGMVVNHIDENTKNNRVDNLEIVTQQINVQKARANNKARKHIKTKIKVTDINTGEEIIFNDCERAADYIGVCSQTIRTHANGIWSGLTQGKYKISRI